MTSFAESAHTVRYRRGAAAYLDGCRCGPCTADYQQSCRMVERYLEGDTLEDIGRDYALTSERVRQRIKAIDPTARRRRRKADQKRREAADAERRAQHARAVGPCRICGAPITNLRRTATCSVWCCDAWRSLSVRYLLDPERRKAHRRAFALWKIESDPDPVQVRSALRFVAGTNRTHGRWLMPGSKGWEVATRAFREGWPSFDRMPDQIQQQVRDHFASQKDPALAVDGPVPAAGVGVCQDTQASGARLAGTGPGRTDR